MRQDCDVCARDAERIRRLGGRQVGEEPQRDHLLVALTELRRARRARQIDHVASRSSARPIRDSLLRHELLTPTTSGLAAVVARHLVGGDPEDPRPEAAAAVAEARQRPPCLLERRRREVVGEVGGPAATLDERVDRRHVPAEEHAERVRIGDRERGERIVVERLRPHGRRPDGSALTRHQSPQGPPRSPGRSFLGDGRHRRRSRLDRAGIDRSRVCRSRVDGSRVGRSRVGAVVCRAACVSTGRVSAGRVSGGRVSVVGRSGGIATFSGRLRPTIRPSALVTITA